MKTPSENIHEAVAFFEKMLQTMPDDRVSLEFLGGAYEQLGRLDKARVTWLQLAASVLKGRETESARAVRQRLEPYLHDPDVIAVSGHLDMLLKRPGEGLPKGPAPKGAVPSEGAPVLSPAQLRMAAAFEEVNLAWLLHERGFLEVGEYEELTVELTEGGAQVPTTPVSALHGLYRMHPDRCDAAVLMLADQFHIVPLRLDVFELDPAAQQALPAVFVRIRGTFPFAKLGGTLLVALLNPLDPKLRKAVESLAGMPCQYFLAHPANLGPALAAFPL